MMKMAVVLFGLFTTVLVMGIPRCYGETFTLSDVYSRALEKHEGIQMGREEIRYAELEKERVRSTVFPKLTFSGTYHRSPEETNVSGDRTFILQPQDSYGMELKIEQSLYSGGKNHAGLRIAERGIEVAEKNLNLSSEALLLRVAQAYYGMLKAQKTLEAQRRNVERLMEHRRLSELRFKVGEVTESILLRAEAELAGARAERVARENDLEVEKRELSILAGLPEGFGIEEPPLPEIPNETGEPLLDRAVKNRQDRQRGELKERIEEERVSFAHGSFLPSLTFEGTTFTRNQDPHSTFFIAQSWTAGARLEFPIFDGGLRRSELAQARSRLAQSRLETARLKKQIALDLSRSSLTLAAVTKVLQSRQEQVRFATKNYEMVSKQFTFGVVTNIDLLDANQVLIDAERDVISATYDRHLAILDLQRNAGVFLSNALAGAG